MSEIIDDVLAGLASTRQTMRNQADKIGEIMEKSNSTLLHIEAQASTMPTLKGSVQPENLYHLSPECELSLTRILEQFQQLMQQSVKCEDNNAGAQTALDCCLATRQRVENLRSSARKLVALHDAIAQLKLHVQEQHELLNNDEKEDSHCEST
ncbi:augmin complex subunit msd1 [Drosophila montana]|uniref:augmin complex subunit msd1 n=1 Tax=Drosophila montana TaxID=40370 RepID=UPI00313F2E4A